MSNEQASPATAEDVVTLKEKLRGFCQALTPGEQVVLGMLLERSFEQGETQGYAGGVFAEAVVASAIRTNFLTPGSLGGFAIELRGGSALEAGARSFEIR
ncbi:MAG TPA: hypothetical protein VKV26_04265 [Dehalococcoidia bacterium]|nr:hypothetical protein [Dehalococcoidia bacterium]